MRQIFAYEARTEEGLFVGGTLAAVSRDDAIDALYGRALVVTSLERADALRGMITGLRVGRSRSDAGLVACFRCVATLVAAGVDLRRALSTAAQHTGGARLQAALNGVGAELERGVRFSEALRRFPREFPPVACALVAGGEASGTLDIALERVAELLERTYAWRRQIFAALAYPATVACFSIALVVFLVAAVIPELASSLRSFDAHLPPLTQVFLALGMGLRDPHAVVGGAAFIAAVSCASVASLRSPRGRAIADRIKLGAPLVGAIARRGEIACCARTLGTMLASGVPLGSAIAAASEATQSPQVRAAFDLVARAVEMGGRIAPAFAQSPVFDAMFLTLVLAGEESGTLDRMLGLIADHYDADARRGVEALSSVLEPLLIVILGAAIGLVVAAVLIPLYATIGRIS